MINNSICSAFIVTRLGQLRNVHTLIGQKSLAHNVLIIMYSKRDKALLSNLEHAYREDLFEDVLYLKLPDYPLHLTPKKGEAMYSAMEEVLGRLHDEFSVKELYVCNIDNYYVYLERIIADRGYPIAINLLEEGLTTYKITSGETLQKTENPPNINDLKKAWRNFKKACRNFVRDTVMLVLQCLGFAVRRPLARYAYNLWLRFFLNKKHRFGVIRHFDRAYVCFPEMVRCNDAVRFGSVEKLDFKFTRVGDGNLRAALDGYSTLFINQKYVNYTSHFRILFQIFEEMGIDKVAIKLHPREDADAVEQEIRDVQTEYRDMDVKILSSTGQIPVEDLVYSFEIKRVIGLTTSALIYLHSGLETTEVISIAERYRTLCGNSDSGVSSGELAQFDDEYRFFKRFEGITQFEPEKAQENAP